MKNFDQVFDLAEGNFGLLTFAQAKRIGVSIRELDRWMSAGRLERVARGLYRIVRFPASDMDAYAIATEATGPDAYVYGESVLAMLKLAPTNPTWLYVASPRRCRKRVREGLVVVKGAQGQPVANYGGVRSQTLAEAIRSCRATVRLDRRLDAVREGGRQGYLTVEEQRTLKGEIKHEATAECRVS